MEMKFIEVANEWFETHKGSVSYSTQLSYRCCINLMEPLHDMKFTEVKYSHLQKLINDKHSQGYSKSQLHHIKVVLCQIYKHAILQEYYEKNLGQLVSLPYNCKYHRRNPIPDEAIAKILSFEHQYQLYFLMLYYTGIRRGEALALQWKDIDFARKTISINKSLCFIDNTSVIKEPKTDNGYRTVPIPAAFSKTLKQHRRAPEDFLFTQITTGKIHTHSSFKKMQNRWLKDLQRAFPDDNIENVTSHMFRHTYITTLFENDFPDYLVKEIVGHADAAFTKRQYYHQSKKYLESSYERIRAIF